MKQLPISLHCWQGDDVTGLESLAGGVSGGIMSTGAFPGKSRSGDELRDDIDMAMSLLPGKQRVNLHASYAELDGETIDRDAYETRHFARWIAWAKERDVAIDFNPTCFGHPLAADNLTLAIQMKKSAGSGLITARPAGASPPTSAKAWASRWSITSGFRTA
jgi:L-rhamnose isomerase